MFTKVFLLCAVCAISVVTANPLLQLVSQGCPICEQNLKNQLQNLLLQQAANQFQPYPQILMNQTPLPVQGIAQPINKKSCSSNSQNIQNSNFQSIPCQNQVINQPYCPCNQVQPSQNSPAIPGAISKILANPALKTILDPNTKLYNQNGLEVPRNGPCNTGPPNVVNNFIIVPPEFFLEGDLVHPKNDTLEKRRVHNESHNNGRQKVKSKDVQTNNRNKRPNTERESGRPKEVESALRDGERTKRRRQKNRNQEVKIKVLNKNTTETSQIEPPAPDQKKEKEIDENVATTENLNSLDQTTTSLPFTQQNDEFSSEKNIATENIVNALTETVTPSSGNITPTNKEQEENVNSPVIQVEVQNNKDTTSKPKRKSKQSSNTKKHKVKVISTNNPREEAVIRDFKRKFPNLPEELVRDLLGYMKRQLQKQNLGVPAFYYPQYPISYDQLYRNQLMNFQPVITNTQPITNVPQPIISDNHRLQRNNNDRGRRRRKNRRKNHRKKPSPENNNYETCDTVVELTPVEVETDIETTTTVTPTPTTILTTTTENIFKAEEVTELISTEITTEVTDKIETTKAATPKIKEESVEVENNCKDVQNEVKMPELGAEDELPSMYINDLIDEYYPNFAEDHQYYSDEDYSFIRLEDDRYHYTTDKNFQLEELNRERRFENKVENVAKQAARRYMFRLKNRPNAKKTNRNRRPNFRTRTTTHKPKALNGVITERPTVKMTIKYEDTTETNKNVRIKSTENVRSTEENTERINSIPEIEEIQFKTPPTLEKIDFETKQINKNIYFQDDMNYKTSSYSDVKTPQYIANEKAKNVANKQKPLDKIETIYAKSKVVTYGKPLTEEKSVEKDIWTDSVKIDNVDDVSFDYDDRTIVFAKSVDNGYW